MDTVLEVVKQFADGKYSNQSVAVALVLVAFGIYGVLKAWVFSEGKAHLLSPREHQLRQRLSLVNECLDRPDFDPMKDSLLDEQQRILFQILHGIDAKATLREDLTQLYRASGGKTTWRDIRMALPHFKQRAGRLVQGYSQREYTVFRWFFYISLFISGFGVLVCALALISALASDLRPSESISLGASGLLLIGIGWSYTSISLPVMRAKQLQEYLPPNVEPTVTTPAPSLAAGTN